METTPLTSEKKTWYAIDVTVESNAREAVEYALMEADALGTEEKDSVVTGYFDSLPDREDIREALFEALRIYDFPSSSVSDMHFREVENRDWLGEWKRSWQPTRIGRFVIAPPWSEVEEREDQFVIRIEPGMAFGTGTHETTRLCLTAIEQNFEGGSFLDVGTGTGILAIAAAKMSSNARIEGCDIDPSAVAIAIENASLNEVADRIHFRVGSIDETTEPVDFVCANLTADVIVPLLPALLFVSRQHLVLSGILISQEDFVLSSLKRLAVVTSISIDHDGEWSALTITK
jgi:ribosomal protein L11 methyltransferase